ncbi:MAG: hypothetical protein O2894_12900 [Planctomycetota bacterium]|nr:hypothetical protein [Planctomycetota bacterium]
MATSDAGHAYEVMGRAGCVCILGYTTVRPLQPTCGQGYRRAGAHSSPQGCGPIRR